MHKEDFQIYPYLVIEKIKQIFTLQNALQENYKVIAIGGGGCNITEYLDARLPQLDCLFVNSDKNALNEKDGKNKLYLNINEGFGCGGDERCGYKAINTEVLRQILQFLKPTQKVIIIASLGGGTGTSSTKAVVKYLSFIGYKIELIVTTPFRWEGEKRGKIGQVAILEFQKYPLNLLVFNNQELLNSIDETSFQEYLEVIDSKVLETVLQLIND